MFIMSDDLDQMQIGLMAIDFEFICALDLLITEIFLYMYAN